MNEVKKQDRLMTLADTRTFFQIFANDEMMELFQLSEREAQVIKLRCAELIEFNQIGAILNLTRARVCQIYSKGLRRLYERIILYKSQFDKYKSDEKRIDKLEIENAILRREIAFLSIDGSDRVANMGIVSRKLVDCDLSVRALNMLKLCDIYTIADLVRYSRNDLLKFRNCGKKTIIEIEQFLETQNKNLAL